MAAMSAASAPPTSHLDSYLELEVYLSRAQKEIGDAFDELVYGTTSRRTSPTPSSDMGGGWPPFGVSSQASPSLTSTSTVWFDSVDAPPRHTCRHCGRTASASTGGGDAGSELSSSIPSTRTSSPVELRRRDPRREPRRWRVPSPPPVPRRATSLGFRRDYPAPPRSISMPPPSAFAAPPSPPLRRQIRSEGRNGGFWLHPVCPPEPSRCRDEPFVQEIMERTDAVRNLGSRSRRDFWESRKSAAVNIPHGKDLLHWCPHCRTFLHYVNPKNVPVLQGPGHFVGTFRESGFRSLAVNGRCSENPVEAGCPVDVDELAAFVATLVDQVNSLEVDVGPETVEQNQLEKFAACFPKAEKRESVPRSQVKLDIPLKDSFQKPVTIGETTPLVDDVFEGEEEVSGNGWSVSTATVTTPSFPENFSIFDRRRASTGESGIPDQNVSRRTRDAASSDVSFRRESNKQNGRDLLSDHGMVPLVATNGKVVNGEKFPTRTFHSDFRTLVTNGELNSESSPTQSVPEDCRTRTSTGDANFETLATNGKVNAETCKTGFEIVTQSCNTDLKSVQQSGNADFRTVPPSGTADFRTVTQSGTADFRTVTQSGTADFRTVTQSGNADFRTVPQSSNADIRTLTQSGNADFQTVPRSGIADLRTMTQSGTADFRTVTQSGTADYRTVTQSGTADYRTVTQSGNADFRTVPQSSNADIRTVPQSGNADFQTVPPSGNVDFSTMPQSGNLDFRTVAQSVNADFGTLESTPKHGCEAPPLITSSPKYSELSGTFCQDKVQCGSLPRRNVDEFMRQLETSIRETTGTPSPSSCDAPASSVSSDPDRPVADAVTQTSPRMSRACSWLSDCNCGDRHHSLAWDSSTADLLDESLNEKLSTLGSAASSSVDEFGRIVPRECPASYETSSSQDNLTADDATDTFSSSSTLGSPDADGADQPAADVWVLRTAIAAVADEPSDVWVRRTGSAKLASVSEHDCEDSPLRSVSTPPHTLPCSRKCPAVVPEMPMHEPDAKFGTVPLSKPKHLELNVSPSGVSHSTPGFSIPSPAKSLSCDKGTDAIRTPLSPWAPHVLDTNKSSSAPILGERDHRKEGGGRQTFNGSGTDGSAEEHQTTAKNFSAPRSQSAKELSELEAVEACKWLRATGFPQYAQMFEDQQFPIDVSSVHKDHDFLDNDSIQSLFRRLNALNRCARMRLDNLPRKISADDSDEENQCALSENWEFQRQSRRWSRIPGNFEAALAKHGSGKDEWSDSVDEEGAQSGGDGAHGDANRQNQRRNAVLTDNVRRNAVSGDVPLPMEEGGGTGTSDKPDGGTGLKRSGSERFKDSAKALLRRVESLKSRRSKRKNREAVVVGPQLLDVPTEGDLACVQITPPETPAAPSSASPTGGESSSPSPNSPSDAGRYGRSGRQFFGGVHYGRDGEPCALSDSECSPTLWRSSPASPTGGAGRCYMENYLAPEGPRLQGADGGGETGDGINYRTGSFNLGVESGAYRERFQENQRTKRGNKRTASVTGPDRHSLYDNVPVVIFNKGYTDENGEPLQEEDIFKNITSLNTAFSRSADQRSFEDASTNELASSTADSASVGSAVLDVSDQEVRSGHLPWDRRDSGVGLSLTRSDRSQAKWQTSSHCHRPSIPCRTVPLNELSSGQMMVIRKLALLKLTALMERYSPSNRSGWNWAMPKFIKRMKTPDYKDKTVFGVPLVVVLQRTGNPIPVPIQEAIRFIRKNAIDSVGIFRKSGVRSRIQKLKNLNESNPSGLKYEEQQPYDVADMIKQYFRELPEALLTNKMSETFIGIYQHIEEDVRLEALQAALVLMPDENREVLQALLTFLNDVSCRAEENQMTASNLAVCFAPSLFHMNNPRSQSTSPRRRKTVGIPDQRELNENRAAHECLTHMIRDFSTLFSIPDDILAQIKCPYMEQWHPPTMEDLMSKIGNNDWKNEIECGIQWILKESREKFKGWVSVSTNDNTELAYKKLGDGNPLRIWKVAVEVEAPPTESLHRVLRDRHLWDTTMLKWRVIAKLENQTEVYQYVRSSMTPLPARDYCVLRSWKTDLPKGTCVLVESSVDHPEAPPLLGGVRAVVLDSKYLIEPCGSGKSRVTHVSRVDTRGRSPDWYNKAYGHMLSLYLSRLRDSLQHAADGPESKV